MNFAKTAWKLVVAIKDLMVLLFLIGFFLLVYLGIRQARAVEEAPRSGALYLQLDGPIVEQPSPVDRLSAISGGDVSPEYRLRDVVHAIETAAGDSAIKAVVLDLDGFGGGGQVAMERVGAALDKVRAAGKPVLAHATIYEDDAYMLAAHASEVWLSPIGMVGVTGPGGSNIYYKGLIDKVGAKIHVYRVGTYKSAVEPYIRADQSPDARAANQVLLDAVWQDWLANVGKVRPKAKVAQYLGDPMAALKGAGGDTAKAAVNLGLVDKLGDDIAFGQRAADLAGEAKDGGTGDFAAIPLRTYLRRHKPSNDGSVAVVTVAGDIVDGEAAPGSAGGYTVAGLIRDAISEDSVKALVLRVDSPGGSVTASEDIRGALLEAKEQGLPVVVSMGNVAASGGYWISTASDTIFAEPATITGSIGVFGIVPSFEGHAGQDRHHQRRRAGDALLRRAGRGRRRESGIRCARASQRRGHLSPLRRDRRRLAQADAGAGRRDRPGPGLGRRRGASAQVGGSLRRHRGRHRGSRQARQSQGQRGRPALLRSGGHEAVAIPLAARRG